MLDCDDLRFILAVGRTGGLSPAARALEVNHSTVSRRVAQLERRLGARLFDRHGRGLTPTEAGREALAAAGRMEEETFDLSRRVLARDQELEGPLRITAPQMIIQAQLADIIAEFAAEHPAIEITVSAANEILNLHRREADVAIRVSNAPEPALYGRVATGQRRGYYAAPKYLRKVAAVLASPIHDARLDLIGFTWARGQVEASVLTRFPNARIVARFDDMIAAQSAARAGMGLVLMPCFVGDGDPLLRPVPGFGIRPYLDIWVLTHPDLKSVERVRRFMRFAAERISERRDFYMGAKHDAPA